MSDSQAQEALHGKYAYLQADVYIDTDDIESSTQYFEQMTDSAGFT